MIKHRRRPRKNTPHLVKVLDMETGKPMGRVVDITADGLMLVADHPIEIGRQFRINIILPVIVQARGEVTAEGVAVWCQHDENPNYYKIGFRFDNITGEDGFLLEDVLHKLNLVG